MSMTHASFALADARSAACAGLRACTSVRIPSPASAEAGTASPMTTRHLA